MSSQFFQDFAILIQYIGKSDPLLRINKESHALTIAHFGGRTAISPRTVEKLDEGARGKQREPKMFLT